jgi:TolB-like protein
MDPAGDGKAPVRVDPSPADIRGQVERILAGSHLRSSSRRAALLRFLVEETLAGRGDRLKGFAVAVAVFGRDETFDSQADPIVRLEARHLRHDLDSYYVADGRHDPVRITIPKGGYVPRFAWQDGAEDSGQPPAGDASEDAAPVEAPPAPVPGKPALGLLGRTGRGRFVALLAALALVLVAAALWWRDRARPELAEARGPAVLVLPFESLSRNEDDRLLADGITQELITGLMRYEGLRLFSVRASFRQDRQAEPRALGRDFGVAYVVRGSLRSDRSTLHLNAQLIDAETEQVLWSEAYDRALTADGLIGMQRELAETVAAQLGQPYGAVNRDLTARLSEGTLPSMPSYACALRAHEYRRTIGDELRRPALACLEAAVRRDPGYADGWALLGWLHLDAARFAFVPDAEAPGEMNRAFEMTSRALALDPTNLIALTALSLVQFHLGNFAESERLQRQALALNPNDPDTLVELGWKLAWRGRWEEGLTYIDRAIARTVNPPGWYYDMITVHLYLEGRYPEMLASAERFSDGIASMAWLAIAHGALGNREAAREALARWAERAPAMARDPASAFGRFHPTDQILDALMTGLRNAGWTEPGAPASMTGSQPSP